MKIDLSMDQGYYRSLLNNNELEKLKAGTVKNNNAKSHDELEDEK